MAKVRARVTRGDTLADQAWAAGCRDVQAAINWATGIGEVIGSPFQTAFRRLLAAQDAAPSSATPADPVTKLIEVGGKRGRQSDPALTESEGAATGPAGKRMLRPKPERNGQAVGEPAPASAAPRRTGTTTDPSPGTPAEFVEDMRKLRHLVTKYGKKGLADLINLLAG